MDKSSAASALKSYSARHLLSSFRDSTTGTGTLIFAEALDTATFLPVVTCFVVRRGTLISI